jgi:hypothetical protein
MSRILVAVQTRVVQVYRKVTRIEKRTLLSYGLFAGFLWMPVLAPNFSAESVAARIMNLIAIVLGIAATAVGGWTFITSKDWWRGMAGIIGLVVGIGLIVSGGFNVFQGNTLGDVVYNLLVDLASG